MTVSKIEELFPDKQGINQQRLSSKKKNDRVNPQIKKPESGNSGLDTKNRDSANESADGPLTNSIIADRPNFYNNYGIAMENSGYFIIPRSVTSDPRYQGARLKYKLVLLVLFEKAAFAKTTHAIGTEVIDINVGQFCVSVRGLADLCNEGVKFKEDLIDKNTIERASHFWRRCGFVRQEVRHGKIVLTITVPEFYERKKTTSETGSETKPRQNRDTKEEYKEDDDKEYHPLTPSYSEKNPNPNDGLRKDDSFSKEEEKIHVYKEVYLSKTELEKCIELKGSFENVKDCIIKIQDSPKREREIKNWHSTLITWKFPNQAKNKKIDNEETGKKIEALYSEGHGWTARVYRDSLKDDRGILFEGKGACMNPIFISFSDGNFKEKCLDIIKSKNMKKKGER